MNVRRPECEEAPFNPDLTEPGEKPDRNGINAVASARSLWITGSWDRIRSLRAAFGLASAARRHPLGRERLRVCLDAAFLHDVVVAGAESLRAR